MELRRNPLRGESSRSRSDAAMQDQQDDEPGECGTDDRRFLRVGYRNLQNSLHVENGKQELVETNFGSLLGQIEELHSKVSKPREQVSDAETLLQITSVLLDSVKKIESDGKITPNQFINALLRKFSGGERTVLDWAAVGAEVGCLLPEAPGLQTMIGPMDLQPKPRKVAERKKTQKPTKVSRPEEVAETPEETNAEVEKNMMEMFKILRKHKRVKLEALLLNRLSFGQTVENVFALSFLVKDGRAEIKQGEEDAGLFVAPKNAPSAEQRRTESIGNTQFVFRFDYADWLFMQTQVPPGEELMEHRQCDQPSTIKRPSAVSKEASKPAKQAQASEKAEVQQSRKRRLKQVSIDEEAGELRKSKRGSNSSRISEAEACQRPLRSSRSPREILRRRKQVEDSEDDASVSIEDSEEEEDEAVHQVKLCTKSSDRA